MKTTSNKAFLTIFLSTLAFGTGLAAGSNNDDGGTRNPLRIRQAIEEHGNDEIYTIMNGAAAASGEYPAYALIEYSMGSDGPLFQGEYCGGILITSQHVLTTATCVNDNGADLGVTSVRIGAATSLTDGTQVQVASKVVHPSYEYIEGDVFTDQAIRNDIAILTLDTQVTGVTPMTFNRNSTYAATDGMSLTLIGFGFHDNTDTTSTYLRKTTVLSKTDSWCSTNYDFLFVLNNDEHMCTQTSGTRGCPGDYGSPLMDPSNNNLVVGLYSWGPEGETTTGNQCNSNFPNFFTDVWFYADWIDMTAGTAAGPTPAPASPTVSPILAPPPIDVSGPMTPAPFAEEPTCGFTTNNSLWQRATEYLVATANRLGLYGW